MPETATILATSPIALHTSSNDCRVAVIWIDWYAYHVARFLGIASASGLTGKAAGIELVGGVGVHAGLKFREDLPTGLPVETLMPDSSWRNAGQLRLAVKLWNYLSRLRPKVLLVPGYYTLPALAAAVWAKLHGCTSVLMTESTAGDHQRVWWKEFAKGTLIRSLFDWAVTGGKAHVRYLDQLSFRADRIARFYDIVDNDFFRRRTTALRKRPSAEFDLPQNYFLYIGRLAPEKNVEGLLSSWISYRTTGGTWPLVLVGDGPCALELQHLATSSGFANEIHFAGHRTSSELPIYYAFAGCFVLPSTREPWGLVVNEAMASALPVIVSNRCGCAEDLVVHGRNGFVFDPSDPSQLISCLHQLEALSLHARSSMGAASAELIEDYSPQGFGEEIARICSQCTT